MAAGHKFVKRKNQTNTISNFQRSIHDRLILMFLRVLVSADSFFFFFFIFSFWLGL